MVQDRFWKAATSCLFILLFSISPGEGTGYASINYQFVTGWGMQGSANGQFFNPDGVAVDSSGYVYVADTFNYRIQKFSPTGTFVTGWGSQGGGNGQFAYPIGVAVDSSGYVYVVEAGFNHRIQKFTSTGTFVTAWGSPGVRMGSSAFRTGVAVDSSGYVYVADTGNDRIQKFSFNGHLCDGLGYGREWEWAVQLSVRCGRRLLGLRVRGRHRQQPHPEVHFNGHLCDGLGFGREWEWAVPPSARCGRRLLGLRVRGRHPTTTASRSSAQRAPL